jgi:hypothetical protein
MAAMKISLKLANGATLEFEGDAGEFDRLSQFLAEPPDSLTAEGEGAGLAGGDEAPIDEGGGHKLSPGQVLARLQSVGAANDQERVTVMGQLAVEAGKDGIDYQTLQELFSELGLRKPAQFPSKTLSNARASNLMKKVKPGIWRPTYRGENFAKGLGRAADRAQLRRRPDSSQRTQGGESD